ncbi:MAG: T9SS C-terminal target domain-containing protein, partial [Bacteroidetes bacterium]
YYKYTASPSLLTSANLIWKQYKVPLAGNSQFTRTMVGTMSLDKVNYVEFHADTWDYGYTLWLDGVQFQLCSPVTAVPPKTGAGTNTLQIWPNPFTENAWISFHLEEGGNIFLEMVDAQGTKVNTLVDGYRQPGNYSIPVSKGLLPSGIYIIRLTTPAESTTRRLVLVK